jgi:hypothetical protein
MIWFVTDVTDFTTAVKVKFESFIITLHNVYITNGSPLFQDVLLRHPSRKPADFDYLLLWVNLKFLSAFVTASGNRKSTNLCRKALHCHRQGIGWCEYGYHQY